MPQTYTGVLTGDRIEWTGPRPPDGPVHVTAIPAVESADELAERQRKWAAALAALGRLAATGSPSLPDDPVAWQREVRRDRPLPGREEQRSCSTATWSFTRPNRPTRPSMPG